MTQAQDPPPEALARGLTYAGFVLVGYELVKDMIVGPIKLFYKDTTFGQGMPFRTCILPSCRCRRNADPLLPFQVNGFSIANWHEAIVRHA